MAIYRSRTGSPLIFADPQNKHPERSLPRSAGGGTLTDNNLPDDIARDRVLSTRDTSRMLGVSEPQLKRWRRSGEGPPWVRLSERRVGYRLSALLAWLDANGKRPSPV